MAIDKIHLINQLIFVGLNGYAAALDRDTGEIVWYNDQMNGGYVTMLLDGDRLIVSTNGYLYCLDPCTGKILWHNPMTGYGVGAPTALVSVRGRIDEAVTQEAVAHTLQTTTSATTGIVAGGS